MYLAYHIWKCILVPKPDMKAFLGTLPDLPSCMVLWGRYILSINVLKYKNFEILSDSLDTLYFCDCPIRHVSSAPNFCVQLKKPKTPNVLLNQTNTRFWGSHVLRIISHVLFIVILDWCHHRFPFSSFTCISSHPKKLSRNSNFSTAFGIFS